MYIKEFVKFKLHVNIYYPLYSQKLLDIGYIAPFFYEGFCYLKRDAISDSIQKLEAFFQNDVVFDYELCHITIDRETNLVYFSEGYYDYRKKQTTVQIEELLTEGKWIELCEIGFFQYTTMSKDNFFYLILTWNKVLDQRAPFALLYQNEHHLYNVLSFEAENLMDQFIADHTKQE